MTDDLLPHAELLAAILRGLGPRTRARAQLVLRALGLTDDDVRAVIEHGLANRLFEADPADPEILRLPTRG